MNCFLEEQTVQLYRTPSSEYLYLFGGFDLDHFTFFCYRLEQRYLLYCGLRGYADSDDLLFVRSKTSFQSKFWTIGYQDPFVPFGVDPFIHFLRNNFRNHYDLERGFQ